MFNCFDKFVLRTPLFPLGILDDVNAADEDTFKETCRNEIFMESVFIASPELYEEMLKWLKYNLLKRNDCKSCNYLPICMGGCPKKISKIECKMNKLRYNNRLKLSI